MAGSVDNASAAINAGFNQGLVTGGLSFSNPSDITQASNAAKDAAQSAYYNAMAQNASEETAVKRAAEAWNETYQGALLSGQYQGKPTEAANEFQQTSTGYTASGAPTLERDIAGNNASISLLNLLGQLKAPANAFQYSKVLNGTPQGLVDIVNSASGRLNIPGFGGGATPVYPVGSSLPAAAPAPVAAAPVAAAAPAPAGGLPPRTVLQAPPPAAPAAPPPPSPTNPQISPNGQVNMGAATLDTLVGDLNDPSRVAPPKTAPLPLPNQIDPVAWSKYTPTQRSLLTGDYQAQGWDPLDVNALRQAALPVAGGPRRGGVGGMFA